MNNDEKQKAEEIMRNFERVKIERAKERERKEVADRAEREKREKESKYNSKGGFSR